MHSAGAILGQSDRDSNKHVLSTTSPRSWIKCAIPQPPQENQQSPPNNSFTHIWSKSPYTPSNNSNKSQFNREPHRPNSSKMTLISSAGKLKTTKTLCYNKWLRKNKGKSCWSKRNMRAISLNGSSSTKLINLGTKQVVAPLSETLKAKSYRNMLHSPKSPSKMAALSLPTKIHKGRALTRPLDKKSFTKDRAICLRTSLRISSKDGNLIKINTSKSSSHKLTFKKDGRLNKRNSRSRKIFMRNKKLWAKFSKWMSITRALTKKNGKDLHCLQRKPRNLKL